MGCVPMTASRVKPSFVRRSRPQDRTRKILVPLNDDELAIVEAEAAAPGLSIEDFLVMRAPDAGEVKGHA
jgi:hypothetical protein